MLAGVVCFPCLAWPCLRRYFGAARGVNNFVCHSLLARVAALAVCRSVWIIWPVRVQLNGWGNQQGGGGGDADMFGMWMDDLGEERSSDQDDVSVLKQGRFDVDDHLIFDWFARDDVGSGVRGYEG